MSLFDDSSKQSNFTVKIVWKIKDAPKPETGAPVSMAAQIKPSVK
jgi:hypothetical protein